MYLVGARFDELDSARAALFELRRRLRVDGDDIGLRPLGSLRYEQPARGLVVAGRFPPDHVDAVIDIMHSHGGEIVFKRADWRTPRPTSRPDEGAYGAGARDRAYSQGLSRLRQ